MHCMHKIRKYLLNIAVLHYNLANNTIKTDIDTVVSLQFILKRQLLHLSYMKVGKNVVESKLILEKKIM